MTNAELVGRVARDVLELEVLKMAGTTAIYTDREGLGNNFEPFDDMNDLFMVLNQFDEYQIQYQNGEFMVALWADGEGFVGFANTLSLAVLQAALKAKGANNGTE